MRKFYLLFATLFACSAVVNAGIKNLYKQDFEGVSDPAAIGWTSPNYAAGLSIQSDDYGSFLSWTCAGQNSRSANVIWGKDIYTDALVDGTYHMQFDWSYAANADNQYQSEVMVFTDDKPAANNAQLFENASAHFLFSLSQLDAALNFAINGDRANLFVPELGAWYIISLDVNVNTNKVDWKIMDITESVKASGTRDLPEGTDPYAAGINTHSGRYNSRQLFDNIAVQVITDYDIANIPSIALTGVNGTERTYTITFGEGETLHVKAPGAEEITVSYDECFGSYPITISTSGTLQAWTTSGEATSEINSAEVECVALSLPSATVTIAGVKTGYAKTYQLTVSNADVPTQPQLFLSYEFKGDDGTALTGDELVSGAKIDIPSKGVLKVTTKAVGFTETSVEVNNDGEFAVDKTIDFQHMTGEELLAKGFVKIDDLNSATTSGESNWTARHRLYFEIATGEVDDEGKPTYTRTVVYGNTEDANAVPTGSEAIQRYKFYQSGLTQEVAHSLFAPVYTWYYNDGITPTSCDADGNPLESDSEQPKGSGTMVHGIGGTTNLKIYQGIGFVHSGVQGDAENYDPAGAGYGNIRINNATMGVDGLTDDDFIMVYKMNDYGTSSVHPQYPAGTTVEAATAEYKSTNLGGLVEVYKGTETFNLYRVDTAITRIETYKALNSTGIESINYDKVVSNHNAPIYNLNGVQVNPNALTKGIYIKQGKKFVVR